VRFSAPAGLLRRLINPQSGVLRCV